MDAKTHDYRNARRGWGHDLVMLNVSPDGQNIKAMGWGNGIRAGDFMLLSNAGGETRYKVEEVNYKGAPSDMWKASLAFAPRQTTTPTKDTPDGR